MAKKMNVVNAEVVSTKAPKIKLSDRIAALEAAAQDGDPVIQGAMGALEAIQAEVTETKQAFKRANKRLRGIVMALCK